MDKQNFDTTVNSLFGGMDHVLSSKTVVGEPQVIGDTIILPLVDISFGMGAGAFNKEKQRRRRNWWQDVPSAILVIHNGQTKLVNIRDQDAITKVLDMVPDAVNKVVSIIKGDTAENKVDPEVEAAVNKAAQAESSVVDVIDSEKVKIFKSFPCNLF